MIWLLVILTLIIGMLKRESDRIQADPDYRTREWKLKWKVNDCGQVMRFRVGESHSYYLGIYKTENNQIERFPFSSSILVAFTDRWHKLNWWRHRIEDIFLTIILIKFYGWWWALTYPGWWIPRGIGFILKDRVIWPLVLWVKGAK